MKQIGIQQKKKKIYNMVKELSEKAKVPVPEVGIYEGPANAFATGYSKSKSLISVSTNLIRTMNDEELKGVLAHEMGHIKNGDMITMTLLEGVLNTFVYFFAELIAKSISEDDKNNFLEFIISIVLQIIFGIFAGIIAMWFSRHREYKADEMSAYLNGKEGIIEALLKLKNIGQPLPKKYKAFGIIGFNISSIFLSHPPIEKRIKHLEDLTF